MSSVLCNDCVKMWRAAGVYVLSTFSKRFFLLIYFLVCFLVWVFCFFRIQKSLSFPKNINVFVFTQKLQKEPKRRGEERGRGRSGEVVVVWWREGGEGGEEGRRGEEGGGRGTFRSNCWFTNSSRCRYLIFVLKKNPQKNENQKVVSY